MKSTFLRLLTSAAFALTMTSVVVFAGDTEKKDGENCPGCPSEAPKSEISNHCGKCDKKDEPCTDPVKVAPAETPKSEVSNHCGKCDKKDEPAKEPAKDAPVEAPKA